MSHFTDVTCHNYQVNIILVNWQANGQCSVYILVSQPLTLESGVIDVCMYGRFFKLSHWLDHTAARVQLVGIMRSYTNSLGFIVTLSTVQYSDDQ